MHMKRHMSCGFDSLDSQYSSMSVFSIILAVFLITVNALGVLGNLLVLITISFNRRFHVMRYLLLSSLAASDFLFLVLVLPTRVAAKLQEDLVWSMTWCQANAFVARSLYCSGNLHLIAISYDRYQAVVKKPLTYDELMNKAKFMLLLLLWVVPIAGSVPPLYSLWGEYAYNQELQVCDQRWDVQNEDHLKESVVSSVCVFAFPLMAIAWLNFKVFKTASRIEQQIQDQAHCSQQNQQHVKLAKERKATKDIIVVLGVYLLCYLPCWVTTICRHALPPNSVPTEVIVVVNALFFTNSACNPIIYGIRKREFRRAVIMLFRGKRLGPAIG